MGRIQQVLVHEGDNVRAGQTLVVLDDAAQHARLEQAQAGVRAAENAQAAAQVELRPGGKHAEPLQAARFREERKPAGDG